MAWPLATLTSAALAASACAPAQAQAIDFAKVEAIHRPARTQRLHAERLGRHRSLARGRSRPPASRLPTSFNNRLFVEPMSNGPILDLYRRSGDLDRQNPSGDEAERYSGRATDKI